MNELSVTEVKVRNITRFRVSEHIGFKHMSLSYVVKFGITLTAKQNYAVI